MLREQLTDERELLLRVSGGDEQAFSMIFRYYYKQLTPFLQQYTDITEEKEEIIQETFIRVWLNRDRLPEIQYFRAWLFKVASREFLLFLRKKLQQDRIAGLQQPATSQEGHTPLDQAQLTEVRALIDEIVALQPAQRRRIYQMSRNHGLKIQDIATALSISVNTVKNSLTTTLKQIREHLAAHGYPVSWSILLLMLL